VTAVTGSSDGEPQPGVPAPTAFSGPPARPSLPWHASLQPAGGEFEAGARLTGFLLLAGIPLGVLWWLVAPRRSYRVAEEGAFAIEPDSEAAVGADGWFMLLTGAVAVIAVVLVWRYARVRGPVVAVALALGPLFCGLVTWLVGVLLGPGPTAAELADLGAVVLGPLELRAHGALVIAPFLAVGGYLLGVCFTASDDLGRADRSVRRARRAELDQRHRHRVELADEQ